MVEITVWRSPREHGFQRDQHPHQVERRPGKHYGPRSWIPTALAGGSWGKVFAGTNNEALKNPKQTRIAETTWLLMQSPANFSRLSSLGPPAAERLAVAGGLFDRSGGRRSHITGRIARELVALEAAKDSWMAKMIWVLHGETDKGETDAMLSGHIA